MQLPNRDQLENSFAVRFTRVNARLRHQLEDYLGYPPDISRVPESFWQEVQDEMNRELAVVLLLIWSQSAMLHGLDAQAAQSQAAAYAASRAQTVAPAFAANTRQMLQNAATRWQALEQPVTRGELQTDLVTVLGPRRSERVATTETTKAQTDGGESAVRQTDARRYVAAALLGIHGDRESGVRKTVGLRYLDKWVTRNDGRVCPICAALHGKPRTVWAAQFPSGPGDDVHALCRCWIEYAVDLELPKGVRV